MGGARRLPTPLFPAAARRRIRRGLRAVDQSHLLGPHHCMFATAGAACPGRQVFLSWTGVEEFRGSHCVLRMLFLLVLSDAAGVARPARCGDCETWVRRGSRPSRSLHGEESMAVESRWRMISARGGGEEFSPPVARGELKTQEGQEGLRKSDRIWTAGHEGRFNLACQNWLPVGSGWAGLGGRQ